MASAEIIRKNDVGLNGQAGKGSGEVVRQGPVDHFKIKPGERTKEEPKITKVFQERGAKTVDLKILDVRTGIEVEEVEGPTKVFQVVGKGSKEPGKVVNISCREEIFSLRASK